jgi:hypothetical protein
MSPSPQAHHPAVTLLRWIAHVLSVLILFFFLVMIGGAVMQGDAPHLEGRVALVFGALAVQLIGLLVAFRKEVPGGLMVVAGYVAHAALMPETALNPYFASLPITGLLRLACAWLEGHLRPAPQAVAGRRASHRFAIAVSLIVAVFLGLVSSEIFMSPPLMAPRQIAAPAELVGTWQGEGRVAQAWVRQRTVPVRLTVDANGAAEGTIGDARFLEGRLLPNRSWLGRALRIQSDYLFRGQLEGFVVAAESIRCDSTATIVFDLGGDRLTGGLSLSCTGATTKNRAPVSLFLQLAREPAPAP